MADEHNNIPENNGVAKPNGFSSKKNIIFIILVAVLTFGIGTAAVVAGVSNSPENRLSRHMRAAERYLSELNYERAVIEYQRVLEIDPMNVDAILGLAEAYIGLGDKDKAIETLRDGLERTGDERIRTRLDELTKTEESDDSSSEVPVCTHEWKEATYATPRTCTLCGETEGESKQTYFEEHGVQVKDAPVDCTVDAVLYDNYLEQQMVTDATWKQLDCYSEPADEDGYQVVHLELLASVQGYYDSTRDFNYSGTFIDSECYDWYTGRHFPSRSTEGDDTVEYTLTIDIDGVSYDVFYVEDIEWKSGEWIADESGDYYMDLFAYTTYTFKIPEGYDGLVLAIAPTTEFNKEDFDTENIDESERFALDEDEYTEGTLFFRINKEGMVPLRQVSEEREPVFGSMGSVNICGVDIDIATTQRLCIYNPERMGIRFAGNSVTIVELSGDLDAEDMEKIRQLSQLRELRILYAGLSEVDALAEIVSGLTNLTSLDLMGNEIRDISPLSGLTNLTWLDLQNNEISDISPLRNLRNLTVLELGNNEIRDISPLRNLKNLENLGLWANEISDISPLSGLTNLTWLSLQYNKISDISPLRNLTNLENLGLRNLHTLGGHEISEEDIEWLKEQLPNCEIN